MSELLSHIDLTPAEIAKLPASIRKKMEAHFGSLDSVRGEWWLLQSKSERVTAFINSALARLPAIAAARSSVLQEHRIEKILEIIADDVSHTDIETELENAEMRAKYLSQTSLLTAQQVRHLSGRRPSNKSEPASRWKRDNKVFAVYKNGINLYPAFQFEDGMPKPIIKKILTVLPDDMTAWQIAFWFNSGNGWLNGAEPQNCLGQTEEIIYAAQQIAEPAFG